MKLAAGVVLYNPENRNRVEQCIQSIEKQIERIYIFDNSTKEVMLNLPKNAIYITEHKNCGIAYALNVIMEKAEQDGVQWVITMDQDSILPDNLVLEYSRHFDDENLAIICPQVIDKRRAYMVPRTEPEQEYIEECITSASCTSVKAWKEVGKFDEWLFIDLVDNEFCKRVIVSGYKILRLNSLILNQEFGKIIPKSKRRQDFWVKVSKVLHNKNFAKFSYKKSVSPLRVYYTNRNIIYVNNKLKKYGQVAYQNYNCRGYAGFWISFNAPSWLRAQDKKAVLKAIRDGVRDGKAKKVDEWEPKK